MSSPAQTDPIATPADSHIARNGRAVSRCAVPAGAASRPSSSSAPTAWVAAAAVTPTRPRNPNPSALTGTRPALATASSMLANSSGLAITIIAAQTAAHTAVSVAAWAPDSPKIVPNSTLTPDVPLLPRADVV